jgi:hypothetical protein
VPVLTGFPWAAGEAFFEGVFLDAFLRFWGLSIFGRRKATALKKLVATRARTDLSRVASAVGFLFRAGADFLAAAGSTFAGLAQGPAAAHAASSGLALLQASGTTAADAISGAAVMTRVECRRRKLGMEKAEKIHLLN